MIIDMRREKCFYIDHKMQELFRDASVYGIFSTNEMKLSQAIVLSLTSLSYFVQQPYSWLLPCINHNVWLYEENRDEPEYERGGKEFKICSRKDNRQIAGDL